MANVMLLYRLKPGVTRDQFETWVRETDYPAMRGLKRVASYVNHRAERLLLGEGAPSVDYVEVFDIPDLDGFVGEDMPGAVVQKIMGEFMGFADAPEFLVVGEVK
jgi:hypothetical protein